jgi:HK97 family phage prohead protease
VDLGGDVVVKCAFAASVEEINGGSGIPILADHRPATDAVLGTIYKAAETERGLRISARFASTQRAQDVRTLLLEGHLSKLSIGYETVDSDYADQNGQRVRLLKAVKLWETSVVVFPMNPEAGVTGAKTAREHASRGFADAVERESLALTLACAEAWVRGNG